MLNTRKQNPANAKNTARIYDFLRSKGITENQHYYVKMYAESIRSNSVRCKIHKTILTNSRTFKLFKKFISDYIDFNKDLTVITRTDFVFIPWKGVKDELY